MKKINLNDVVSLIEGNPYHWAQNTLYITTSENTIIIKDCPKEKYELIILNNNMNKKRLKEMHDENIKVRVFKETWQTWEINLIKKHKHNYKILKTVLSHRTINSIKSKSRRILSK